MTCLLVGYIGPGPGLSMLGALIGFCFTLILATGAIAMWPFRVMMRKRRERREAAAENGGATE